MLVDDLFGKDQSSFLPSLFDEALTALSVSEAPSAELLARVVSRIQVASVDEIHQGLHRLWRYTRHIGREDWLKTLSFELKNMPSAPPLRGDAQQWIHQWEIARDAELPKLLGEQERVVSLLRDYVRRQQEREAAARELTSMLASRTSADQPGSAADHGSSAPGNHSDVHEGPVDPLAQYLPPIEDYDGYSYWYDDGSDFEDTLALACSPLLTITEEVRAHGPEDSLFWAVLGRVYEPFCNGNPDELENKIASAKLEVLALRVCSAQADLLDYLDYFEEYRGSGGDFLEPEYESFLEAVEQSSPAECGALFPKLLRLNYETSGRPPRPAEEHLPIADRLWAIILAKPDLSVTLVARAGLFYWLCRDRTQAPVRALMALGRACEGDSFEFWGVPPFLPFWVASRAAAKEGEWSLATLCWKRALVDVTIFVGALQSAESAAEDQVHAFAFDPRFVKHIHLRARGAEPQVERMLHLALQHALDALRRSDRGEWSQLHFVLLELSRRLGVRDEDESAIAGLLGDKLYSQIDRETRRLLAEAEAAWSSGEQSLERDTDCALIGWTYRRAIENEWRLRLGPVLRSVDRKINPDRATLGEMLSALRQLSTIGQQLARHQLTGIVRGDSRIFDQLFLRRASNVVGAYLNEASHRGLGRRECSALRTELLKGRLLHDLLASVQRPDDE